MKSKYIQILIIATFFTLPIVSAAHWIVGYVEDAIDSTSPNGRTVRLWNPSTGQELFGTVGASGLSGTSNVYMIDCDLLPTPCQVGDNLNLTLVDDSSGYTAKYPVEVTVSGAGFDMAPNISMNTPLGVVNLTVEDSIISPENEIDLTAASTANVLCSGISEGAQSSEGLVSASAEFYLQAYGSGNPDDNNEHYTNSSCQINTSYGSFNQAMINCTFEIEYYAEAGLWECKMNVTDNNSVSGIETDSTTINTL